MSRNQSKHHGFGGLKGLMKGAKLSAAFRVGPRGSAERRFPPLLRWSRRCEPQGLSGFCNSCCCLAPCELPISNYLSCYLMGHNLYLKWQLDWPTEKNCWAMMSNLAIRVIRKSVLPLMDIALTLTRTSANMVGQIAGRNYDHKREVVSRRRWLNHFRKRRSCHGQWA